MRKTYRLHKVNVSSNYPSDDVLSSDDASVTEKTVDDDDCHNIGYCGAPIQNNNVENCRRRVPAGTVPSPTRLRIFLIQELEAMLPTETRWTGASFDPAKDTSVKRWWRLAAVRLPDVAHANHVSIVLGK